VPMGPHGEAPASPWDLSLWVPQRALDQQRGAGQDRLHAPGQAGGTSARPSTGDQSTGAHILDPNIRDRPRQDRRYQGLFGGETTKKGT
jgi:hypothetical protein